MEPPQGFRASPPSLAMGGDAGGEWPEASAFPPRSRRTTAPGPRRSRGERSFFEGCPLPSPPTALLLRFIFCSLTPVPRPPPPPYPTPNPLETEETATRSEPPDTLALSRGSPLLAPRPPWAGDGAASARPPQLSPTFSCPTDSFDTEGRFASTTTCSVITLKKKKKTWKK